MQIFWNLGQQVKIQNTPGISLDEEDSTWGWFAVFPICTLGMEFFWDVMNMCKLSCLVCQRPKSFSSTSKTLSTLQTAPPRSIVINTSLYIHTQLEPHFIVVKNTVPSTLPLARRPLNCTTLHAWFIPHIHISILLLELLQIYFSSVFYGSGVW